MDGEAPAPLWGLMQHPGGGEGRRARRAGGDDVGCPGCRPSRSQVSRDWTHKWAWAPAEGWRSAGPPRARCTAPARSLPEAPRSVGTSSTPPSWPPMCTPRWRNWFRWRLEESADPFSVLESGSDSQCTCLILMFYLPWFVTGLTLTLRALCVQFSAARPVWLSWSCSQNHPPRSRGIRARPPFAVWHTVCE